MGLATIGSLAFPSVLSHLAIPLRCSRRQRWGPDHVSLARRLLLLLFLLCFCTVPVTSMPANARELYSKPFRAVFGNFGRRECASLVDDSTREPFTIDFTPPKNGPTVLSSGAFSIPASAFSLNGFPCNRSESSIHFPAVQPPPRAPSDITPFSLLLELLAKSSALDFMFIGAAEPATANVKATIDEAQCIYSKIRRVEDGSSPGSFGTFAVRLRHVANVQLRSDLNITSPTDNTSVLNGRAGVLYTALHVDIVRVPDGSGTICLMEPSVARERRGKQENPGGSGMELSTGQILGIAAGATGLALLLAGVVTFVHWRRVRKNRQPPQPGGRPVEYKAPDGRVLQIFVDAD